MATTKEFITEFLSALSDIEGIAVRPMMGEYVVYYRDKVIGDVCDNRVLIKPVDAVKEFLPEARLELPYEGAKPLVRYENYKDAEFTFKLFEAMFPQLSERKVKKRR